MQEDTISIIGTNILKTNNTESRDKSQTHLTLWDGHVVPDDVVRIGRVVDLHRVVTQQHLVRDALSHAGLERHEGLQEKNIIRSCRGKN